MEVEMRFILKYKQPCLFVFGPWREVQRDRRGTREVLLALSQECRVHLARAGLGAELQPQKSRPTRKVVPLLMGRAEERPVAVKHRLVKLIPDREIAAVRTACRRRRPDRTR